MTVKTFVYRRDAEAHRGELFPLEVLDRALMLFRSFAVYLKVPRFLRLPVLRIFLFEYKRYSARLEFPDHHYSTVTDFARLRGWSTSHPRLTAM